MVDGRGNAYLNSMGLDMMAGEGAAPGIVAVVRPDGSAHQVADGVSFPNGLAVTSDNRTLIVAEPYANRLTAFDIDANGGLSDRRVWADLGDGVPAASASMSTAPYGAATSPTGAACGSAKGGEVLEAIDLDRGCSACTLGGADHRTLFTMAAVQRGPEAMADPSPAGQVPTTEAPAPRAGWS